MSDRIFGFDLNDNSNKRKKQDESSTNQIIGDMLRDDDTGASFENVQVGTGSSAHFMQRTYTSSPLAQTDREWILEYRRAAAQADCDTAINEIINEAISETSDGRVVDVNLSRVDGISSGTKTKVQEEFHKILSLMNFSMNAQRDFRQFYIDGRIGYYMAINEEKRKEGLTDVVRLDPIYLEKKKFTEKYQDPKSGARLERVVGESFVYNPPSNVDGKYTTHNETMLQFHAHTIAYATSGRKSEDGKRIVSLLHKALKRVNQLEQMEDSLVIYRLVRAPERRVFYIDMADLPNKRVEEEMNKIKTKYKTRVSFDAKTGLVNSGTKHSTMIDDYFLPRMGSGRGTEISTLNGSGDSLGRIEDVEYFQKKLYKALDVPIARLEGESQFSMGRSSEITRDENRFQKFIDSLRKRFSMIFNTLLKTHLVLKNIITEDEWYEKYEGNVYFDFARDTFTTEMREQEMLQEKMEMTSRFFNTMVQDTRTMSRQTFLKKVWGMSDEEIKNEEKLIEKEKNKAPKEDGEPQT